MASLALRATRRWAWASSPIRAPPNVAAHADRRMLSSPFASTPDALSTASGSSEVAGVSSMLSQDDRMSVIQAHDKYGFTVNGIHMRGSVLVFPSYTLLWNVTRLVDACPRNTAVVHMVRPKVDLLLIGTGAGENINPSMFAYFQRRGISVEPMSTMHAIATFNTLVAEGRFVAAGLVSRSPITRDDACVYTSAWETRESEGDRRLRAALRRDPYGSGGGGGQALLPGHSEVSQEEQEAAAARAASAPPPRRPVAGGPSSEELSTAYGYPGAITGGLPDDVSLALTEEQRQERAWRRTSTGGQAGRPPRRSHS